MQAAHAGGADDDASISAASEPSSERSAQARASSSGSEGVGPSIDSDDDEADDGEEQHVTAAAAAGGADHGAGGAACGTVGMGLVPPSSTADTAFAWPASSCFSTDKFCYDPMHTLAGCTWDLLRSLKGPYARGQQGVRALDMLNGKTPYAVGEQDVASECARTSSLERRW